jgi:hypothetical protein
MSGARSLILHSESMMNLEMFSRLLDPSRPRTSMSKDEVDVAETILAAEDDQDLDERVDEVVTSGAAMTALHTALARAPTLTMPEAVEKLDAIMRDAEALGKLDRLLTPNARALLSLSASVLRAVSSEAPPDWMEHLAEIDITQIVFDLTTPALVRQAAYENLRHVACSIALARIMDEGEPRGRQLTLSVVNMATWSLYKELCLLNEQPSESELEQAEKAKQVFARLSRGGEKFEVTVPK